MQSDWILKLHTEPLEVYTFWVSKNLTQLINFDLFAFVKILRDKFSIFNVS